MSDQRLTTLPGDASPAGEGAGEAVPSRRLMLREWLAVQPLVPPALGLVLGIALDAYWRVPFPAACLVFMAGGLVVVLARRSDLVRFAALMIAGVAVGVMLHDLHYRHWPAHHIVRYCGESSLFVRLTGTVIREPALRSPGTSPLAAYAQEPRSRFLLAAESLEGVDGPIPVTGTVSVVVRGPVLDVSAGDRVELFGAIYRPAPPDNPGGQDWSRVQRRNGVLVEMTCRQAGTVERRGSGSSRVRFMADLRRRARGIMLEETFPGETPGSRLLAAMVLGQRSAVDQRLTEIFVNSGTVHYLSVSGAHVGIVASVVWLACALAGASRRSCAMIAIVCVTAYAVLAEPRPPILRAAIMANLLFLAMWLRRPVGRLNWLALSALILLAIQPMQLFKPGFQMSYATIAAIVLLAPRIHELGSWSWRRLTARDDPLLGFEMQERLNPSAARRLLHTAEHVLGWWLAIALAAWMVGSLMGLWHFQHMAPWGWINTLVVLPLVWAALVLGLLKTVVTAVLPVASGALGPPLAWVADLLVGLVTWLNRLPGSGLSVPVVSGWVVLAGFALLVAWSAAPWLRVRGGWYVAGVLALACAVAWDVAPRGAGDALRMQVLSVGSGKACVLLLPNGQTLIYDIGADPHFDLERWTVGPYLARERAYRVDAALISHAHLDHYGGLPELLERRRVRQVKVMAPPHFAALSTPDSHPRRLVEDAADRGVPWRSLVRGDRLTGTGDVTIDVLWPPDLEALPLSAANDTSLVLRISYAGKRILLCGDAQAIAQSHLLNSADLAADVLLLPHHGGVDPTTGALIRAVDPRYTIRSSGERDRYTTNGLLELVEGTTYYNTADDGAVEVRITRDGLSVMPFRPRRGE